MKRWFRNAMENARLDETAQEHHNKVPDLDALYDKLNQMELLLLITSVYLIVLK